VTSGTHNAPVHDPAPAPSDATVSCAACGYDLRGFRPRDRCPECGTPVAVSLAARVAPAAALDPAWRRRVQEGAALSLIAFAFLCISTACPAFSIPAETGSRLEMLNSVTVFSAAGWALQWVATIKLCHTAGVERRVWTASVLAWLTQGLATVGTLVPLLLMHYESARDLVPQALVDLAIWLTVPLCAAAYYLCLRGVFHRFGAAGPAAQATLLAAAIPATVAWARSTGIGLGAMGVYVTLPSYQHGIAAIGGLYARSVFHAEGMFAIGQVALPAVVSLCGTYLHVRLLLVSGKRWGASDVGPPAVDEPRAASSARGEPP